MLNLAELKEQVEAAIESAVEYGDIPEDIKVSILVEGPDLQVWSADVDLHYDNDVMASGCVLVGEVEVESEALELKWNAVSGTLPPHGIPVWLWSKEWIDEDFNPTGVREGHFVEDTDIGFVSCGWNPEQDTFTTEDNSKPTLWAHKIPPKAVRQID